MTVSSDFQSLQLNDEPPEEVEDDPFTAKLMSFDVSSVISALWVFLLLSLLLFHADRERCERCSNPVGASEIVLGFLCNCLSYFTTAKISFTSIIINVFDNHLVILTME